MEFSQSPAANTVTIGTFPLGLALEESADGYFVVTRMARALGELRPGHELINMNGVSLGSMSLKELEGRLAQLRKERKTVTFTYRVPPDDMDGPLFMPFDVLADPACCTEQATAMTDSDKFPGRITTIRAPMQTQFTHAVNTNDIITPNDLKKTIINIDSRFRDSDQQTSTNFTYRMDPQIKNIIRIKLVSIEFPNVFYTFSQHLGNTRFTIKYGALTAPITIEDGNYTPTDIQTAIQAKLVVATGLLSIPAPGLVMAIDGYSSLVTITAPVVFSLDFTPSLATNYNSSGLGWNLGFTKCIYTGATSYTGESVIDMFGEQYVLFQLNGFNNVEQRMKDKNIIPAFAKIVFKSTKFSMNYDDSSNFLTKEIIFAQPHNLSQLTVSFVDAYGTVINNDGLHISFALEVTEVMNCKLYDYYRNYLLQQLRY
jgi:hypothetical protein